jgi:hypothetical protein
VSSVLSPLFDGREGTSSQIEGKLHTMGVVMPGNLGHSQFHGGNAVLILNVVNGHVSSLYHIIFDYSLAMFIVLSLVKLHQIRKAYTKSP